MIVSSLISDGPGSVLLLGSQTASTKLLSDLAAMGVVRDGFELEFSGSSEPEL